MTCILHRNFMHHLAQSLIAEWSLPLVKFMALMAFISCYKKESLHKIANMRGQSEKNNPSTINEEREGERSGFLCIEIINVNDINRISSPPRSSQRHQPPRQLHSTCVDFLSYAEFVGSWSTFTLRMLLTTDNDDDDEYDDVSFKF